MYNESYSLSIVSQHSEFKGRSLKKYSINGLETIGVWGNEPFEIVFKNNTCNKIQVKLSIDGTDILTGKPADTGATGDMWSVNGYGTLTLKAWPETNKGGAQFIFTSAEKSVAVNTHGDVSSRGVIAAAVYVEGYQPILYNNDIFDIYKSRSPRRVSNSDPTFGYSFNSSMDSLSLNDSRGVETVATASMNVEATKSLQKLAAVGAGQHVVQIITNVTGLTKPVLSTVARVRFVWWDDLQNELRANGIQPVAGSGFPGEEKRMMSIGSTPRQDNWTPPPFTAPSYSRF